MAKETKEERQCSFCAVPESKVQHLVVGTGAAICSDCLIIAENEINDKFRSDEEFKDFSPSIIVKYLNQYVIGQDAAKRALAVAVWNHIKRSFAGFKIPVQKSNVWIIGDSGSGKTLLLHTLARFLDIPFASIDASTITESGYVGEDPDIVIARLYREAEGNLEATQKGIVFIDEIDKLAKSFNTGGHRDIKGVGVQQALLRMIEGDIVAINPSGKKKGSGEPVELVNTKDILFVLGGAFVGIKEQMQPKAMGIGSQAKKREMKISPKDLMKYGMIPELVGRVPIIAETEALTEDILIRILTEPNDALTKQYQSLLAIDGVKLTFSDDFLKAVVKLSLKNGTGARGLRAIMESSLQTIMFHAPDRIKPGEKLPPAIAIELTDKDVKP